MRISAPSALPLLAALVAPLAAAAPARAQATVPYPPPGYARSFQGAGPDDLPLEPPFEAPQEMDRPAPPRRRLAGPRLRLAIGPNHLRLQRRASGQAGGISGTGAWIATAAGIAVHPRLAIFGELALGTALRPHTSGNGADPLADDVRARDQRGEGAGARALTSVAAGAGLCALLETADLELLASFLLSQARLVDRDRGVLLARTRFGPTVQLGVARSWETGDHLQVGLQLRAHGARLAASDGNGTWWGLGLLAGLSLEIH